MADENRDREKAAEADRTRPPAINPKPRTATSEQSAPEEARKQPRGYRGMPRAIKSRIMGRDRPGALPEPARRDVTALAPQPVVDKWTADAAGVRAVSRDDNVITMFGVIGEDFWSGEGVTAKKVSAQLRAIGDRDVEVQINSPGGDLFEGIAIYNVLREHLQAITIKIVGMAASAASVIAMAGDTIEIGAASFLMIHNAWVVAMGNRHDMRETADFLEPFDKAIADVLAARSGQPVEAVQKWLDDETYMSGSVAIERGFADALLPADKLTKDDEAKTEAKEVNDLRAMELQLVSAGLTRSDARDRINRIKGTPGAASEDDTPGAVDDLSWLGDIAGLTAAIRS